MDDTVAGVEHTLKVLKLFSNWKDVSDYAVFLESGPEPAILHDVLKKITRLFEVNLRVPGGNPLVSHATNQLSDDLHAALVYDLLKILGSFPQTVQQKLAAAILTGMIASRDHRIADELAKKRDNLVAILQHVFTNRGVKGEEKDLLIQCIDLAAQLTHGNPIWQEILGSTPKMIDSMGIFLGGQWNDLSTIRAVELATSMTETFDTNVAEFLRNSIWSTLEFLLQTFQRRRGESRLFAPRLFGTLFSYLCSTKTQH
eukprot:TRINITY_DN5394_c0_g1_i4.p1 TRINITY_DN5394_c0_g1~~TRINITY_DN5394_c0_g1_i4.p1  ORF type:complete len:257 (-),score=61.23 TRINITY_DN5394_c0_g1_i4:3-773(-)